ncbi:hypothetical protein CLS_27490 [[Clostridium] cf. saccharolyticum K10]|nr:hypothetical protein CLS_27490 [[Clostridium] cf. saccharolyticum K10]
MKENGRADQKNADRQKRSADDRNQEEEKWKTKHF